MMAAPQWNDGHDLGLLLMRIFVMIMVMMMVYDNDDYEVPPGWSDDYDLGVDWP